MPSNSSNILKAIIIDDEPMASDHLKATLLECNNLNIDICDIANNTTIASRQIETHKPDVLLLDIEMPDQNAFQFLENISPFDFEIIFVTAFNEYAVKAFKLNAIDYILKPVSIPEITEAFARLREKIAYKQLARHRNDEYKALVAQLAGNATPQKLFLREQNNITAVAFTDIYFIEAMGSYSRIHYTQNGETQQTLMSHSISEYEEMLPQSTFIRIHKSYLINCTHIKNVCKNDNASVTINGNYNIPVSRRRYHDMMEFIRTHDFSK